MPVKLQGLNIQLKLNISYYGYFNLRTSIKTSKHEHKLCKWGLVVILYPGYQIIKPIKSSNPSEIRNRVQRSMDSIQAQSLAKLQHKLSHAIIQGINGLQSLQGNALQSETPSCRLFLFPETFDQWISFNCQT